MKWILILTIFGHWDTPSSVRDVGPFETKEACMAAANAWLSARTARPGFTDKEVARINRSAICAQTK